MLKRIFLFLATSLVLANASAQEITYPEEVRVIFAKADSEITEYYRCGKHGEFPGTSLSNNGIKPRIAIPDCEFSDHLKDMARLSGGEPVDMPAEGCSNIDLRRAAISWDGVAMPDNWVKAGNEYSVLVYKTITDWNLPYIGISNLTQTIDKGLMRLPCRIPTFEELTRKASVFREASRLMDEIFTIDTHCDLPDMYSEGWSVGKRSVGQCGIPKMDEGHLDSQVLISFLWQGPLDNVSSSKAVEKNLMKLAEIKEDVAKYPELCGIARTPAEADSLTALGKKAFLIAVENGYGIGNDIGNIKKMKDLGVVYITLCHFRDNAICNTSSRHGSNPSKGLTEYGREVIAEMNRLGILIDLSHPSSGTFWDCIKYSDAPVICSHSGAKAVYGHDRGLDDKQLKALAENGGLIQIYSVPDYIGSPRGSMTIENVMRHFDHCVKVAGPEHVGIGSDFDGGGGVWGCDGDNDLINITVEMLERGYTHEEIKGFWGGNFKRVWGEALAISNQD